MNYFVKKSGMTLVELMVAISIVLICMFGFSVFFARIWVSNHFILEEGQTSFIASRIVSETVKNLRKVRQPDNGEYPIRSCDEFNLVVFIDIDKDNITEKVHYFLENGQFKVGISDPSGSPPVYPSGDQTVSVLTNYVVNTSAQPVFEYYNHDYPGDVVHNPIDTPVAAIEDVRLVKIHLYVNIDPMRAPDNVNIESFAEFRNLNDYQ
jgi:prepilin-type N-terminal cleavage/methylation domain-containing protein